MYHRSLHAGQYHIHPLRIALVRLPKEVGPIGKQMVLLAFDFLAFLGVLVSVALMWARMSMAPLFVIPGIFYVNRYPGYGGYNNFCDSFSIFIFFYPCHPT